MNNAIQNRKLMLSNTNFDDTGSLIISNGLKNDFSFKKSGTKLLQQDYINLVKSY